MLCSLRGVTGGPQKCFLKIGLGRQLEEHLVLHYSL